MDQKVRDTLLKNMDELTYDDLGGGLFQTEKRDLVEGSRYLLVSLGGTGADVLQYAQKLLLRNLNGVDNKHLDVLAIDTDRATADKFAPSDVYILNGKNARNLITTDDAAVRSWINPNLAENIKANATYCNGKGASATRQIGRLLLSDPQEVNTLTMMIQQRARRLIANTADQLRVFVICGIAGGTGSGTVIDATYLIHSAMQDMTMRYEVNGIILLPPTGGSTNPPDIASGNRNGYAALKEIDYFMRLVDRGEVYERQVGTETITVRQNIFNTCYLLDGNLPGIVMGNPRKKAVVTASRWLLDLMSSTATEPDGTIRTIDSHMSDGPSKTIGNVVPWKPVNLFPREATYTYTVIGNHQTIIPLDLVKTYVAKKLVDVMDDHFQRCGLVNASTVEKFLKDVLLPTSDPDTRQKKRVEDLIYNCFQTMGPYYVVNLSRDASKELERQALELSRKLIKQPAKQQRMNYVKEHLLYLNHSMFEVFTTLLDELKKILADGYSIFVDTERTESRYGSTYSFTPIQNKDSNGSLNSKTVEYLDNLISGLNIPVTARKIMQEVYQRRDNWIVTESDGHKLVTNAAATMRDIWTTEINAMVDAGLEDMLIKHYSGDPSAKYDENNPAATEVYLDQAAREIVEETYGDAGQAQVMADTYSFVPVSDFYGEKVLLIPKAASHLKKAVEENITNEGLDVIVAESTACDVISAYSMYSGLPAFLFQWTARGEESYERDVEKLIAGLHLSETPDGKHWSRLPDLMPSVGKFDPKNDRMVSKNAREHSIADEAKEIFDRAKAVGLTELLIDVTVIPPFPYSYTLFDLEEQYRPDAKLLSDIQTSAGDAQVRAQAAFDTAAQEKANALFAKLDDAMKAPGFTANNIRTTLGIAGVTFNANPMRFAQTVITGLGYEPQEQWPDYNASRLLRCKIEYMDTMKETVAVMEKLHAMVESELSKKAHLETFVKYLMTDMFIYDQKRKWQYLDITKTQLIDLYKVDPFSEKLITPAIHYFLYQAFHENYDSVVANVDSRFQLAWNGAPGLDEDAKNDLQVMLRDKANQLKNVELKDIVNPMVPGSVTSAAYVAQAKLKNFDTEAMRQFYLDFQNQLFATFGV